MNWYGLGWLAAFLAALWLVRRWAPALGLSRDHVENLAVWSLAGAFIGARLYFIAQNDPASYLREPWRILMIWEGGLAFFGGLFGAILAAFMYARRRVLPFARAADLFAPAIPIASAIGRIPCWLAGMDYGTTTTAVGPSSIRTRTAMRPAMVCHAIPCSCTSSSAIWRLRGSC